MTKLGRWIEVMDLARANSVKLDENTGFCLVCGAEHYGVEPDTRKYDCKECKKSMVYGAHEIIAMLYPDGENNENLNL